MTLGAALVLELMGLAGDPRQAVAAVDRAIESGRSRRLLQQLRRFGE
jgi:anthranilate phosphoribosyltransferase